MCESKAEMDVFHFFGGISAVPSVDGSGTSFGIAHHEWQGSRRKNWESTWLVTGVDVRHIRNSVACHVIVVKGLTKLLRWKERGGNGSAGGGLKALAPRNQSRVERVLRGHPTSHFEIDGFILRLCTAKRQSRKSGKGGDCQSTCQVLGHGVLAWRRVGE